MDLAKKVHECFRKKVDICEKDTEEVKDVEMTDESK